MAMTNAATTRTIVLVRHAKAEHTFGKADRDRDLTPRGRRDAKAGGEWLHDLGLVADVALCSISERTRQTWEELQFGGAVAAETRPEEAIYFGGSRGVLALVRDLDPDVATVFVVGHAPAMPDVTSLLSSGEGSTTAHEALAHGYPTCGIAVMEYAGAWSDLAYGSCSLRRFHVARG